MCPNQRYCLHGHHETDEIEVIGEEISGEGLMEETNFNTYFDFELFHPMTEKRLSCAYRVNVLNCLRG